MPVSYTHLDVYKRQKLIQVVQGISPTIFNKNESNILLAVLLVVFNWFPAKLGTVGQTPSTAYTEPRYNNRPH